MRKLKGITLLLLLLMVSGLISAQKKNVIKANLFSPLVRTGSFFFEHAFNESSSVQLGFFYTGIERDDTEFKGFGITPEYRFYLSDNPAPHGLFVAPYFRYQSFELTSELSEATLSVVGGGLLIGGQTMLKDVITLEAFLGPAYGSGSIKVDVGLEEDFETGIFDGFGVRFGMTIGVAF